jgi:hypothetical protein
MELINAGGRLIQALTEIDAIQFEPLAAVCAKSQMASYFGMTEKTSGQLRKDNPRFYGL